MNVLIIEDEKRLANDLANTLKEIDSTMNILEMLGSVSASLEYLLNNPMPDLIMMDIELNDGLSFEILEQADIDAPVIFTTAYNNYAIEAFKANSIDYLVKPIKKEALEKSIEKLDSFKKIFGHTADDKLQKLNELSRLTGENGIESGTAYKKRLVVQKGKYNVVLNTSSIAYFYTGEGVVFARKFDGSSYLVNETMENLEGMLDPLMFFRANRKILLSVDSVMEFKLLPGHRLIIVSEPKHEEDIIVGRRKRTSFIRWCEIV